MEIRATLKPGQKGTRKLLARYGANMICVRYRYDQERQQRYTTVELIVDEVPWQPTLKAPVTPALAKVKIAYGEAALARLIKEAGGQWNRAERVWELPAPAVAKLGLEERLVSVNVANTSKSRRATDAKVSMNSNQKASNARS